MSCAERDRDIYLKENRYDDPKSIFKFLLAKAVSQELIFADTKVCDIGCAAGEFLHHILRYHDSIKALGLDLSPELIVKAKKMVPKAEFITGSLFDFDLIPNQSQDVVFMNGVHSSLADIDAALKALIRITAPGGHIFVFGIMNPYPIDVSMRYKFTASDGDLTDFFVHSCSTVSNCLDAVLGEGKHSFSKYELDVDVPYSPEDPFRSWTFKDEHGKRILTNGLSALIQCYVLEIKL